MSDKTPRCGALTSKKTPCQNEAGKKTEHFGSGKCYLHGGASEGAPKGNKNALVTGQFEHIHKDALSDAEKALWEALPEPDPRREAQDEIKLASIREHRILIRIRRAAELEEKSEDGMEVAGENIQYGWNVKGKVDFTTTDRRPISEHLYRLESALTAVQALKSRYIEQLRNILKDNPPKSGGLEAMVAALDAAGAAAAARIEGQKPSAEAELDAATEGVL